MTQKDKLNFVLSRSPSSIQLYICSVLKGTFSFCLIILYVLTHKHTCALCWLPHKFKHTVSLLHSFAHSSTVMQTKRTWPMISVCKVCRVKQDGSHSTNSPLCIWAASHLHAVSWRFLYYYYRFWVTLIDKSGDILRYVCPSIWI